MRRTSLLVIVALSMGVAFADELVPSGTHYVEEALKPYVASGELPGAICVLEKDGRRETCCVGYANVDQKLPMTMDSLFMQCSQTKGFCGVTMAILVRTDEITASVLGQSTHCSNC